MGAKKYVFYGSKIVVDQLMSKNYRCNIVFIPEYSYEQALKNGFDPEKWEKKNNNHVLVEKDDGEICRYTDIKT